MEEMIEELNRYEEVFGERLPTIPILLNKSKKEVIDIIDRCISEHKTVYEMGYLEIDDDIIY